MTKRRCARIPAASWVKAIALAVLFVAGAPGNPAWAVTTGVPLGPSEVAVVINDNDPASVETGNYYASRRSLPATNVIHVSFATSPGQYAMSVSDFNVMKAAVDAATPASVQAFAIAWTVPFRVGCMSITAAMAMGFNDAICAWKAANPVPCTPTNNNDPCGGTFQSAATCTLSPGPLRINPYFNSDSRRPYTDFGIRPAIMLAGTNVTKVKALIDRGIAADGSLPPGTGYLVKTSDATRSVRACAYPSLVNRFAGKLNLQYVDASGSGNGISSKSNVLFDFTGIANVPFLNTNQFLPGAIADHLTSCGGFLTDPSCGQTTALNWLEDGSSGTGATASYGTVFEPCANTNKFPTERIVLDHYYSGETLIEAYWKSVLYPEEGVFAGEPLAKPFGPN